MDINKYKLIKTYPSSPELGIIIERGHSAHWFKQNDFTRIENNDFKPSEYSEFWELVVKKDYEIIKQIPDGKNRSDHDWNIYSIKRLSDGETFAIGDKIKLKKWVTLCTIVSFEIIENNLKFIIKDTEAQSSYSNWKDFIKIKPSFKTEDRVDIFVDDEYFVVNSDFEIERYVLCTTPNGIKQFSTKDAANKWILKNKHSLSLNDVFDTLIQIYPYDWRHIKLRNDLESLIKK